MAKTKKAELKALMGIPEVEDAIRERLPVLIQRMFDLAEGALVMDIQFDKETGEPVQRVYRTLPDRQALQFLIENSIGKTPQRIEMTGKDGGPVSVVPWAPMEYVTDEGQMLEGEFKRLSSGPAS